MTIRYLRKEDWRDVRDIWLDFKSSIYSKYDVPQDTDEDSIKEKVALFERANEETDHCFFAVCLDKVIGYYSLSPCSDGYEIGYRFHSAYFGNGYAKESLSAIISLMKGAGARTLTVRTALANEPSVGLLKSLGFVLVGKENVSFYLDEKGDPIYFEGGIFKI